MYQQNREKLQAFMLLSSIGAHCSCMAEMEFGGLAPRRLWMSNTEAPLLSCRLAEWRLPASVNPRKLSVAKVFGAAHQHTHSSRRSAPQVLEHWFCISLQVQKQACLAQIQGRCFNKH